MSNSHVLLKFDSFNYYEDLEDKTYFLEKRYQHRSRPTLAGGQLVAKYYREKYGCNIIFYSAKNKEDTLANIGKELKYLCADSKKPDEKRIAILLNFARGHTIPIVYIKRKDKEALFFADSLKVYKDVQEILFKISFTLDIPIYYIPEARQHDTNSCRNDGLIIARETTAKKDETQFNLPGLLEFLEKNSSPSDFKNVFLTNKLPVRLLKSTQSTTFLQKFMAEKKSSQEHAHKQENIRMFLDRYKLKNAHIISRGIKQHKDVIAYTILKGQKNRNIIKIQYYVDQLKEKYGQSWCPREFIRQAKLLLKSKSSLSDQEQIEALHQYVSDFIMQTNKKNYSILAKIADYLSSSFGSIEHTPIMSVAEVSQLRRSTFL